MVILVPFVFEFLWASPGAKSVRKLRDGKDPFAAEFPPFPIGHPTQQAQVIAVDSLLPATVRNSHSPQCRFRTRSGAELLATSSVSFPVDFRTSPSRPAV